MDEERSPGKDRNWTTRPREKRVGDQPPRSAGQTQRVHVDSGIRRCGTGNSNLHSTEPSSAGEEVPRCKHAGDRIKKRFLRFLYTEKPQQTGRPRWICSRALERLTGSRRTNQERSQSHHSCCSAG